MIACAATGVRPASNGPAWWTSVSATSSGLAEETSDLRTTSASELLAALIWAQPLEGARLAATIIAYRQAERDITEAAGFGQLSPPQVPRRGRPRRKRTKNDSRGGDVAHKPPGEQNA